MANTLVTPNLIKTARAIIYTKSSAVTVSTSATLLSLFSGVFSVAKNIIITPPKGDVKQVVLLGETVSTKQPLQTFQNYILEEASWELPRVTGTLSFDINEDNLDLIMAGSGTATVTATYHMYQYGGSDSGKTRVVGAILIVFKHGSGIREILLNNAYIISLGDIKSTSSEGHIERDFEITCAIEDYVDHFKD